MARARCWLLCSLGEFLTSRLCPFSTQGPLGTKRGWERPLSTPRTPKWDKQRRGGQVRRAHSQASDSREEGRGALGSQMQEWLGAWLANEKTRLSPGERQKQNSLELATAVGLGHGLGELWMLEGNARLLSTCCVHALCSHPFSSQRLCRGGGICSHLTEEKTGV